MVEGGLAAGQMVPAEEALGTAAVPDPHRIITVTQLAASPLKAARGPPPRCPQARPMSHEALQSPTLCPGLQPSSAGSSD